MRKRILGGLIPAFVLAALPAISSAGVFVGVSVNIAPPALPVYVQPPCPEPGYMWTPGYWAWNDGAYYWVPGTWVLPPLVGLLWTPGYWGWEDDGDYLWHAGYWGRHVGFYGGVDYGYGYAGDGFDGGYWRGSQFYYNRAVVHVGPTFVRNVYYHPVVYHTTYEHVSFNGGPGGVRARPSHEQMAAEHERHMAFTSVQQRQQRMAFADHSLRADYNHGRPPVAATARPAEFHGKGAFAARAAGGPMHAASMRSDRPSWANGPNHGSRPMENNVERGQPRGDRPQSQRFDRPPQAQRFDRPPQAQRFDRPQAQRFDRPPQAQRFDRPQAQRFDRPQAQRFDRPQSQRFDRPQVQRFDRPQAQRFDRPQPQHFERPQPQHFEPRPAERPEVRPQPELHQSFRPEQRGGPAARGGFAPQPPQRGGGERPQRHPPESRDDGHGR